jgi:VWFA-related protein
MKRMAMVYALTALAFASFGQEAAQQPFQEQIDVNAVLLDVIVTDSKGNQILGLGKDDFIVKEDGVEQSVESVDYFTNRRLLDQREESAPFKVERVREERYFIFFLDKPQEMSGYFDELQRVRHAGQEFLKSEMQPTDYVAVVGHDHRLKIYSDFTNDRAQLEKAFENAIRYGRGISKAPAEGPSILRGLNQTELVNKTGRVYEAIDLLADALRPIRGRKNLLLFSAGILDNRETVNQGMITNRIPQFEETIRSLNASNVAVYGIQLRANVGMTPVFHQRLTELSEETGGRYFRFNTTFAPALERIENTNSGYYLVTYSAKKPKGTRGYQKVDVTVKHPELRVVARSGYQFGG